MKHYTMSFVEMTSTNPDWDRSVAILKSKHAGQCFPPNIPLGILPTDSSHAAEPDTVDNLLMFEGMMKIRELALADALLFAALALTLAFMGHRGQNLYFLVAAAAFVVATYLTYPPAWLLDFAKSRDGKTRRK